MYKDWSSYVFVTHEGEQGGAKVLCIRNSDGPGTRQWRLPGGPKMEQEQDSLDTARRTTTRQTGINIYGLNLRRIGDSIKKEVRTRRNHHSHKLNKHAIRFYRASLPIDRLLRRSNPADGLESDFLPLSILRSKEDFLDSHRRFLLENRLLGETGPEGD
ncbi:MAG TPA: hypothetical protein VGE53_01405 [Candidatus Paceibacterota bacterium]